MRRYFLLFILASSCSMAAFSQATGLNTSQTVQDDFSKFLETNNKRFMTTSVSEFTVKGETMGSRYFSDRWISGSVTNIQNVLFNKSSFFFNYDKVSGDLLMTEDKHTVVQLYKDQIKSFSLQKDGITYTFERVDAINDHDFFQPIVENNNKYSLYKLVKTKLVRANYVSDGISESGNNYDEYVDQVSYYIVFPGHKQSIPVELKKKSIKKVLDREAIRTDAYFSEHSGDNIDENFLKGLVEKLNG